MPKDIGLSFRVKDWHHNSLRGTKRSSQAHTINKVNYKQGTSIPKKSVEQVSGDDHAHIRFVKVGFFLEGSEVMAIFFQKIMETKTSPFSKLLKGV